MFSAEVLQNYIVMVLQVIEYIWLVATKQFRGPHCMVTGIMVLLHVTNV